MTSKGNKKMGAEMSATKNIVKNEFKQFLGPSIGARPMRAGANAISSSGTGKKTYKADKMTPYLFMGLQQMRTAGGRQALVEQGAFNFSGPPPETQPTIESKYITSELSGTLLLATHAWVGISFEMDQPPIKTDKIADVVSSITMKPTWGYGPHSGTDATVSVWPETANYSRIARVVQKVGSDPSTCHVFFEFSANKVGDKYVYANRPYSSYEFNFQFKNKSGATEQEKRANTGFKAVVPGDRVFDFASKSSVLHSFKNMIPSNDGKTYDRTSKSAYFLDDSAYKPVYFKTYSAVSSHGGSKKAFGVDVCLNYFPTGGSKTQLPPASLTLTDAGEISFNIAVQPAATKVYRIQDLSMELRNRKGDKVIDHVHYAAGGVGADVSYHFNDATYDASRVFAKPTKMSYEEGRHPYKMSLKVNEVVSSTYPLGLSFDQPLWTNNTSWLFGTNDVSYSVGTAPYNALTNDALDISANAKGTFSYINIDKELITTEFSNVTVRVNPMGPKGEKMVMTTPSLVVMEADVMPLESDYVLEGSSNLADGFKLAATPDDKTAVHARNKVIFQFKDDVIGSNTQLNSVAYQVKGESAWTAIASNQTLEHKDSNYVEASFNVLSGAGYDFQVSLKKKTGTNGTKHPHDVSYYFLGARGVPANEIYQFPTLKYDSALRTIGGVNYDSAKKLSNAVDLSYVWRLTPSSNSQGVPRLAAEPAVDSTPDFKKKMDISFIDISFYNSGLKNISSQVQDISLGQLTTSFDLSFIHKYPKDVSYDLTYNLRHGDVVYSRDISNFVLKGTINAA